MYIVQINRVNRIGNEVDKILTEHKNQNQKIKILSRSKSPKTLQQAASAPVSRVMPEPLIFNLSNYFSYILHNTHVLFTL